MGVPLVDPAGLPGMFTPAWLTAEGFVGFQTVRALRTGGLEAVPEGGGVYVVLWAGGPPPGFGAVSTGGHFKGRDPSVPLARLESRWISKTGLVYIGKADVGGRRNRGLKIRVGELLRFGAGAPIGHWGGRLIWQMRRSDDLVICWKPTDRAAEVERELLSLFERVFGMLPLANLRR
jgi:hypothetical protein